MNDELNIIKRVLIAQQDINAADDLIHDYIPFIKNETAKVLGRIPIEGEDDELSVAFMGFHEAVESYNQEQGAFITFASMVIRRRIIDFLRQENRFKQHASWEAAVSDEKGGVKHIPGRDALVDSVALKWEIKQFVDDLKQFDITISEVAANCPKHKSTMDDCRKVVAFVSTKPEYKTILFRTGRLPVTEIIKETSVSKRTLERYRKYLIALTIIYFQEYDCMIDHLSEIFKSQKGGK